MQKETLRGFRRIKWCKCWVGEEDYAEFFLKKIKIDKP